MNKYQVLLMILDKIRGEAVGLPASGRYLASTGDAEHINQARARAYIHLYLMVTFGLLNFSERERLITDNAYDGGIDAYFIDPSSQTVYLIQSKFRTTDKNFDKKNISIDELLSMDIARILDGNEFDEQGNAYNGKIKQLIREIGEIENIARYKYCVIILANMEPYSGSQMKRLFDGHRVEVFDHERCYDELVFPVVSGTYYKNSELNIFLDLSNKNAGSKISYEVKTEHGDCEITVLFVPTIEVAKTLSKYKNSILRHNPRSYLELEGKKVNGAIRETILKKSTNEFALFNNGITMISDDTNINEKIGKRNKAQLAVTNPQIINGGQTAYTLSKIYDELGELKALEVFEGKEVLLKVITLMDPDREVESDSEKLKLVDAISTATNQQTAVIEADRASNDPVYKLLQDELFKNYGLFFERKRGEFGDGISKGYIVSSSVLERNLFFRLYLASIGDLDRATGKKAFLRYDNPEVITQDPVALDNFYFAYLCYQELSAKRPSNSKKEKDFYAWIYILTASYKPADRANYSDAIKKAIPILAVRWNALLADFASKDTRYVRTFVDKETGEKRVTFNGTAWYRSYPFEDDIKRHFGIGTVRRPKQRKDKVSEIIATATDTVA